MSTTQTANEDVPTKQAERQADNPAAPLKVWSNHVDTVVASDWGGVVEVLKEKYGRSEDVLEPEAWRLLDPRKEISIHWNPDRHGFPTPHSIMRQVPEEKRHYTAWTHEIYAPAFAWAQLVGDHSLLCSTEW